MTPILLVKPPFEDPPAGDAGGSPSMFGAFLPFVLIGLVFWVLIIAPERKNRKKREVMLGELKKGDHVMTNGGLYGTIAEVRDHVVILKAGDVRLKYSRAAIQGIVESEDGGKEG